MSVPRAAGRRSGSRTNSKNNRQPHSNSSSRRSSPIHPPPPESETDEDWDLANVTDTEDAAPSTTDSQLSHSTLAALSALPLCEAWRLVRARVTYDHLAVDPGRLYVAGTELVDVVGCSAAPIPTRLLALFLLYALYFDTAIPITLSSVEPYFADLTPSCSNLFSASPIPLDLPLLFNLPPHSGILEKLPSHVRTALAVSVSHPFLGIFLHVARSPHTSVLEKSLVKLLLVCPRPPLSANSATKTDPPPLLVRDNEFLCKTAVHLATFSDTFSGYLGPTAARFADSMVDLLATHAASLDSFYAASQDLEGFVPLINLDWNNAYELEPPHALPTNYAPTHADSDACETAELTPTEESNVTETLHRASTTPLDPKSVTLPLRIPARLVSVPGLFTGLVAHSPKIAVEIIQRTWPLSEVLEDVVLQLPPGPLRLAHLTVVEELWQYGTLDKTIHLPVFVSRVLGHAMGSAMPRTVQIAAKFLAKHVLDLPLESLFEIRNFCSDYLRFKDASDLYKTVGEIIASSTDFDDLELRNGAEILQSPPSSQSTQQQQLKHPVEAMSKRQARR